MVKAIASLALLLATAGAVMAKANFVPSDPKWRELCQANGAYTGALACFTTPKDFNRRPSGSMELSGYVTTQGHYIAALSDRIGGGVFWTDKQFISVMPATDTKRPNKQCATVDIFNCKGNSGNTKCEPDLTKGHLISWCRGDPNIVLA